VRPLTLRRWSVADWLGSEAAWGRLLARSNADALFLSWDWLTLWWHCFASALSAAPEILAFYRGEELVGVAPHYRRRVLRSGVLPAQRKPTPRAARALASCWRSEVGANG